MPARLPPLARLTIDGCAWIAVALILVAVVGMALVWFLHLRSIGPA